MWVPFPVTDGHFHAHANFFYKLKIKQKYLHYANSIQHPDIFGKRKFDAPAAGICENQSLPPSVSQNLMQNILRLIWLAWVLFAACRLVNICFSLVRWFCHSAFACFLQFFCTEIGDISNLK